MSYAIKIKGKDLRRWEFLKANGSTTNLRIHAPTWDDQEKAKLVVAALLSDPDNAGYEIKVVQL